MTTELTDEQIKPLIPQDMDWRYVVGEAGALEFARGVIALDRAARGVPDEMDAIASQYAHKLALDMECVLADYSGEWWDTAIKTLGAYREAMNAIHERESPTFMGEPL